MTNITPRASMSPLGRQPFRPGQWQGYKGASKSTTYIQNNFFGSGYNSGMNYGNYNNCYNNCNNEPSKFMKWMMGIGVGTSLLGSILKMFGGKEEAGAIEPEPKKEVKEEVKTEVKEKPKAEETVKTTTVTPKAKEEPVEEPKEQKINWNNITNMVCTDASGKTKDISGKLALGDNGEPPKSFTITDTSSGTANVYKYELQSNNEGEKPVYKCVSKNGQPVTSENRYNLETGADGQPKLVQEKGQANHGQGLQFKSVLGGGSNNGGFTKTITVNTSVGQAKITITGKTQKELDEKVAEREKESEKWAPKQENKPTANPPSSEAPAYENPWASVANGTAASANLPWGSTTTKSSTAQQTPQQQPSQATQKLNQNLQADTLSADRKKAATEALDRVNTSKLPENRKEELRQKLADVTIGLQSQNKFNQVITEVNLAAQA